MNAYPENHPGRAAIEQQIPSAYQINSGAMYETAEPTRMNIDTPADVAGYIIQAIQKQKANTFIGFPEKFFCKINVLFPRLVDRALAGQNRGSSQYAKSNP